MNKLLYLLPFLFLSNYGLAQNPYFWDLGGNGAFIPVSPKDSVYLDQITMPSQKVSILLYPGFAVLKGEYHLYNTSSEDINLQLGYPTQGLFFHTDLQTVAFNGVSALKVLVQGDQAEIQSYPNEQERPTRVNPYAIPSENYSAWSSTLKARDTTQISIYFLVNNNQANLRIGYGRDLPNGFTYALSSASIWQGKINKGEIRLQLADTLKASHIQGLLPFSDWQVDASNTMLYYKIQNVEPDSSQNLVIRYGQEIPNFDFKNMINKAAEFYRQVDSFHEQDLSSTNFSSFQAQDFKVYDQRSSDSFAWAMFILIYTVPILMLSMGAFTFYRLLKAKRQ